MPRRKVPKTPPEHFPKVFAGALVETFEKMELTDGLHRWAQADPGAFYQLLGRLMPSELHLIGGVGSAEPADYKDAARRLAFTLAQGNHDLGFEYSSPIPPPLSAEPVLVDVPYDTDMAGEAAPAPTPPRGRHRKPTWMCTAAGSLKICTVTAVQTNGQRSPIVVRASPRG